MNILVVQGKKVLQTEREYSENFDHVSEKKTSVLKIGQK